MYHHRDDCHVNQGPVPGYVVTLVNAGAQGCAHQLTSYMYSQYHQWLIYHLGSLTYQLWQLRNCYDIIAMLASLDVVLEYWFDRLRNDLMVRTVRNIYIDVHVRLESS